MQILLLLATEHARQCYCLKDKNKLGEFIRVSRETGYTYVKRE
jgi:hypothetical protein